MNLSAYALLDDTEINRLASLTGDDLHEAVNRALTHQTLVVGIASHHELVGWIPIRVDAEEPLTIVKYFLKEMQRCQDIIRMEVADLERWA